MKHQAFTRLLSLVVALQLLCAPIAMVRAAEVPPVSPPTTEVSPAPPTEVPPAPPAEVSPAPPIEVPPAPPAEVPPAPPTEVPPAPTTEVSPAPPIEVPPAPTEIPEAELTLAEDPPGEPLAFDGYLQTAICRGLPRGEFFGIQAFESRFQPESAKLSEWFGEIASKDHIGRVAKPTAHTTLTLPAASTFGRVPDLRFEGYYAYTDETINSTYDFTALENILDWTYRDQLTRLCGAEGCTAQKLALTYNGKTALESGQVLPIVGRWAPSSEAKITELTLETTDDKQQTATPLLYPSGFTGKATPADSAAIAFSPETTDYYLRVDARTKALTKLDFSAFEPYFDYHKKLENNQPAVSPVTVTVTFGGVEKQILLTTEMLPEAIIDTQGTHAKNTVKDSAHSVWRLQEPISLEKSAGAGKLYNELVITVKAPDNDPAHTKVYRLHIQRMADPVLTQNPGNMPYGMIARDTHPSAWGDTPQQISLGKSEAYLYFKNNHRFYSSSMGSTRYPQGTENQSGSIFRSEFTPGCWLDGTPNYDMDKNAIAVYQDSAFCDPGFTITDSEGNPASFGAKNGTRNQVISVKRTLKLRTAVGALTPEQVKQNGGKVQYYAGGALFDAAQSELVTYRDGSDQVNLQGKLVLPGIYAIEYCYTDPVTGISYDATGASFAADAQEQARDFRRTMLVLPAPGDVDMDGAVTLADAVALEKGLNLGSGDGPATSFFGTALASDPVAQLFALRVCDLTHDGNCTRDDVAKLVEGLTPVLDKKGASDYYYIPLPTGDAIPHYTRQKLPAAVAKPDTAQLTLEYLGVDQGAYSGGVTSGEVGPQNAYKTQSVTLGDTFWMGVKLSDVAQSAALKGGVTNFTFTLAYDGKYLVPATVLTQQQLDALPEQTEKLKWEACLRVYNLAPGGFATWKAASGFDYTFTSATKPALPYTTHYSKAITPLESAVEHPDNLKELVFSIRLGAGKTAQPLEDGYLLAVPFTLKEHPYGKTSAQLVEMSAGMREFAFVHGESTAGGLALLLYGAGEEKVAAYSAQSTIFGDSTQNLGTAVQYQNGGGTKEGIPLGKDKTQTIRLYNQINNRPSSKDDAVYDTEFYNDACVGTVFDVTDELKRALPPGLTIDKLGKITGTPTQARSAPYSFRIRGETYSIEVKQAPLRYYAEDKGSYYGESEFRGEESDLFTFRYYTEDIRPIDKARADQDPNDKIVLDGNGAHLGALLRDAADRVTYVPPAFGARTAGNELLKAETKCKPAEGAKIVVANALDATSQNYKLEFVQQDENGVARNRFTVSRRPIQVRQLKTDTLVGAVYSDTPGVLKDLRATLTPQNEGFLVENSTRSEDTVGLTLTGNGRVGTDSLVITYQADFIRRSGEENGNFILQEGAVSEVRFVDITQIALQKEGDYANYRLVSTAPTLTGTKTGIKGTVNRRNVTALRVDQMPTKLKFTYGDKFEGAWEMWFSIVKGEGSDAQTSGPFTYNAETCKTQGVTVSWVTAAEKAAGTCGLKADGTPERPYFLNQLLTPALHDGNYLCISTPSFNKKGEKIIVKTYSDQPITVAKREMTLTANRITRYYGEENGALGFTYRPKELAPQDQHTADGKPISNWDPRDGAELKKLLCNPNPGYNANYTPPTLAAQVSADLKSQPVTAKTNWTGNDNAVTISGATADNYLFRYTAGPAPVPDATMGYSTLRIEKRYVVATDLIEAVKKNIATLYADTRSTSLAGSQPWANVVAKLPEHTQKTTDYYPLEGTADGAAMQNKMGYAENAPTVFPEDAANLQLCYTAQFVADKGAPEDFPNGYFDFSTAVNGSRSCQVEVKGMTLAGAGAANYQLVFDEQNAATVGGLTKGTFQTGGDGRNYYVCADGTVMMRPVIGLALTSLPQMDYHYGEKFAPTQPQSQGKAPLQVTVEYSREFENDEEHNIHVEPVDFKNAAWDAQQGIYLSSFDLRGLKLYSVPADAKDDVALESGMELKGGTYVTPKDHNGRKLLVAGGSARTKPSDQTLKVEKRPLILTAEDQYRYYGEENPISGAFSLNPADLAEQDRAKLTAAGIPVDTDKIPGDAALSVVQPGYTKPSASVAAGVTKTSPVVDRGRGGYPVTISGGEMENYTLQNKGKGTLYVFRRPIRVKAITSDETHPVYTIYADTDATQFTTQVSDPRTNQDAEAGLVPIRPCINEAQGIDAQVWTSTDAVYAASAAKYMSLPLTGDARIEEDQLTYSLKVRFGDLGNLEGMSGKPAAVTVSAATLGMAGNGANYYQEASIGTPWNATGYVNLRNIESIRVLLAPSKFAYAYPESLNLTGLRVEVTYNRREGETVTLKKTLDYKGKEQFASEGLYVNYYDGQSLPPMDQTARGRIASGRIADNLDHLTIAPAQDTQGSLPDFTANGKTLVVSARLHEKHDWVEPKIVKEEGAGSTPAITVSPLQLKYTLTAADKTYDGDTRAVGTIAFQNAYRVTDSQDYYNPGTVHDVVYPVIGADYEDKGTNHADYTDFKTLTSAQYAFKTGDYTPEDPAVFNDNGALAYLGGGYDAPGGKLKFRFTDPNVAYEAPTAHDRYGALKTIPVEATDLHLGGPDAANYTVEREITAATIQSGAAPGYLSETLPEATILKRNRDPIPTDLLPKIQLDRHTNVIRADYHKALEGLWDPKDAHNQKTDEAVHFEYALDYLQDSTEGRQLKRWAGNDGTLRYQDTIFFGGEALDPGVPKGYLPDPNDIPKELKKEDVVKGQIYRWMEEDKGDTLSGMEGFLVCDASYPGGKPYLGYELFETKRTALPRVGGEVYYPLVRLAETHNYWASPVLSPVTALTPQLLDADERAALALETAELALAADPENQLLKDGVAAAKTAKQKTAAAVMTAITVVEQKAQSAAQTEVQQTLDLAENGRWQEEFVDAAPSEAVQIYRQRMEVTSIAESRGTDPAVKDPFIVPTLEAVWFTNVLDYKDQDVMDAVLRNREPTRYYGYFWDKDKSGMLDFTDRDNPFSLQKPFSVEIEERDADGKTEKKQITVNENHSAHIFAELVPPSSGKERAIHVVPHEVTAKLGDKPLQLTVEFVPTTVRRKSIVWTSADPKVAVVDERNVLTFVGVGTTTITATSRNKKTDTITVTVIGETEEKFPTSVLDLDFTKPYIVLDEALRFRPELKMTRGELVEFLAQFYKENPRWMHRGTGEFTDLTGKESYAEAARLMGSLGIVNGTAQDRFDGDAPATRGEMVTLLARMLDIPPETLAPMTGGFRDSRKEDTWAYGYINALSQRGLLSGVGDGLFAPGRVITRGEAVTLIGRLMNTKIDPGKKNLMVPSDVPQTHWGYYEILRAVNTVDTLEPKNPNEKQS